MFHITETSAGAKRRLRVLYLDHTAEMSGGEIALLRLLRALGPEVEAHVLLGHDGALTEELLGLGFRVDVLPWPAAADVRKDRITMRSTPLTSVVASWRYARLLARLLREERPDIVHTNSLKAAVVGGLAGRMARVPVLWHIRDRISSDYLPKTAVLFVGLCAQLLPSAVVANSNSTLATIQRFLPPWVGRTVVQGVIDDVLPVDAVTPGWLKGKPETKGRPVVALVGRLAPWKGQDVFVRAIGQVVLERDVEAWLVGSAMFGEQDYERLVRQLVGELGLRGRVHFLGFRNDVPELLGRVDLLVHASVIPEPFGQVVVEGMAAGVPVIAADAGGPAEIIVNGENGMLVRPGDPNALAQAIDTLLADDEQRRTLSRAGRETAERFRPDHVVPTMLTFYQQVIEGRGQKKAQKAWRMAKGA